MCFRMEKFVEKKFDVQGLQCVITRADLGEEKEKSIMMHRCGYVRIPVGHPWHGKDYDDIPAEVHGGLTFGELEECAHADGVGYWIGFDFAHYTDASVPPDMKFPPYHFHSKHPDMMRRGHYWTLPEVETEVLDLVKQVVAAQV